MLAPLRIHIDPRPATGGGPDMVAVVQHGVPAFRLHEDGTHYFDYHHTDDDTIDRIDPRDLAEDVAAWAALLWLIAEREGNFR